MNTYITAVREINPAVADDIDEYRELRCIYVTANVPIRGIDEIGLLSDYRRIIMGQNFNLVNGRGSASTIRVTRLSGIVSSSAIVSTNQNTFENARVYLIPNLCLCAQRRESASTAKPLPTPASIASTQRNRITASYSSSQSQLCERLRSDA